MNESVSAEISDLFIKELDRSAMVIKQTDIAGIAAHKSELVNGITKGDETYLNTAQKIYRDALKSVDSALTLMASKKIDFTASDTLRTLPLSAPAFYSPDLKYHLKRIERNIKLRCFERVANTDGYDKYTENEFIAKAKEFSVTILANYQKNIKALLAEADQTVEAALLNAIALRFDPHSNYFTQEQNQEFKTHLSAEVESFGFYLDEDDDGNVIVGYIEPGGAAWLSNEVNEGDFFISARIGNFLYTNESNTAYDIQDKLEKSSDKKVVLTLKKQNGQLKQVKLIKQKAASTDNSVKGYLLKVNGFRAGYISLPSFYTDMDEYNKPGCANDVAKEILKLEGDSIQGLIIDLRNNGGGSMQEAMNLAGIFVDEGPLFILKDKGRKPYLVKDVNRGSVFKKPLVVMINETSASASELFANIIKDYNLGVIVGQTSYGKGTAQNVLPLDTNLLRMKNGMEIARDFIKITNSKFYRLNNTTHQGNGVVPDVSLPASPGYSIYKENKESYYIEPDVITKNVVYTPNPAINISVLQQKSKQRIEQSADFKRYRLSADSVENYLGSSQRVILKFKEFKAYRNFNDKLFESIEHAMESRDSNLQCLNNTFDKQISEVDDQTREFNLKIREAIQKDIFINEACNILLDLKMNQ